MGRTMDDASLVFWYALAVLACLVFGTCALQGVSRNTERIAAALESRPECRPVEAEIGGHPAP